MSLYERIRFELDTMPIIDSHDHIIHSDIGRHLPDGRGLQQPSELIRIVLGYNNRIPFLNSGLPQSSVQAIIKGQLDVSEAKRLLLNHLADVSNTTPYIWMVKGFQDLYGFDFHRIDEETWDLLEERLQEKYSNRYAWITEVFDKLNFRTSLLNIWAPHAAHYYGSYQESLSPEDRAADKRCFTRIATFDYYSLQPFSGIADQYAELAQSSCDTFEEYELFLEKLADFFVNERQVKGFKIVEAYFRRLDYSYVSREEARKAFKKERTPEDQRILGNYTAFRIFELAEKHRVPVQIHTGKRWGELGVGDVNPIYLEEAITTFRNVKFDLLHAGYPYMGEMSVIAANSPNVYLNLSALPLNSYDAALYWLGHYLDMIPRNKITIGWDVFNLETLYGGCHYTKNILAQALSAKVEKGLWPVEGALAAAERIMYKNAAALYKLEQM